MIWTDSKQAVEKSVSLIDPLLIDRSPSKALVGRKSFRRAIMNSKERVALALDHKEPDRIPFDLGGTFTTGIHITAHQGLRWALGLPAREPEIFCLDEQIAVVAEDMAEYMGVDTRPVLPGNPVSWKMEMREGGDHDFYYNEFGMGLKMPRDGFYYDVYDFPLADARTTADLDAYPFPDPLDPGRYVGLGETARRLSQQGHAVVLNGICAGLMEMATWLMGFERFYTALALEPDFVTALLERLTEFKMAYWQRALAEVGDTVLVVQESDDLGAQEGPLISPRLYRELIFPHHQRLFDFIHAKTRAKLFLHSCGAIRPLIPSLIAAGVDILNPVQVSAAGVEPG
jgi:uroporphyrinogen decarboxylase